jgi:hypothetical protein
MTLKERTEDIRKLTRILRDGWGNKKVLRSQSEISELELPERANAGWETVMTLLALKLDPKNGSNAKLIKRSEVIDLLGEAEAFLARVDEQSEEIDADSQEEATRELLADLENCFKVTHGWNYLERAIEITEMLKDKYGFEPKPKTQ